MFGEKYDERVRVVDVPGVSMELCGGTHVANTAEVAEIKPGPARRGWDRRIEAVAGPAVVGYDDERAGRRAAIALKAQPGEIVERVAALQEDLRATAKALSQVRGELAAAKAGALVAKAEPASAPSSCWWPASMGWMAPGCRTRPGSCRSGSVRRRPSCSAVSQVPGVPDKVVLVAAFGPAVVAAGRKAGAFIGGIARLCGGGGGGWSTGQAGKDGEDGPGTGPEARSPE